MSQNMRGVGAGKQAGKQTDRQIDRGKKIKKSTFILVKNGPLRRAVRHKRLPIFQVFLISCPLFD